MRRTTRMLGFTLAILLILMMMPMDGAASTGTKVQVWLTKTFTGVEGDYLIGYTNGNTPIAAGSQLSIQFPIETDFAKTTFAKGDIILNGTPLGAITADATNKVVNIPLATKVEADAYISVQFTENAGIINPLAIGNYQIGVTSPNDASYILSNNYIITGTPISSPKLEVTNPTKSAASGYTISFDVSNVGALFPGDRIYIAFPKNFTLPMRLAASTIKINGHTVTQAADLIRGRYVITLPTGVAIANSGEVKLQISNSAGIKNTGTVGSYSVQVNTSKDSLLKESNVVRIGEPITNFQISLSPNTYNIAGQYYMNFKTSKSGALVGHNNIQFSDYIEVSFPEGTVLPSNNFSAYVFINGENAQYVSVKDQVAKIYLPEHLYISEEEIVSLLITPEAKVLNPATGTYRLQLRTSKDAPFVNSQYYKTVGGSSTPSYPTPISQGAIKLSSTEARAASSYQFTYVTGNVDLEGGIDELNILFVNHLLSQASLPEFIDRSLIRINQIPLDTGIVRISGNQLTFRLPSKLNVKANTTVIITIDVRADIKHPNQGGDYLIIISDSQESNITSYSYEVKGQSSYNLYVTPKYDSGNQIREYDLSFKTSSIGALKGGYDWISIKLPRILTRQYFIDNFDLTINSIAIDKNKVQVSGDTLSFLVPDRLNIPATADTFIKLKDRNNYLGVSLNIQFKLSTSKDHNWVDSNIIRPEHRQVTGAPSTNTQTPSQQKPVDQNKEPTEPEQSDTTSDPNEPPRTSSKIQLFLGNKDVYVNGMRTTPLIAAPYTTKGTGPHEHTMVPLRFVSESLGAHVEYRTDGKKIMITYQNKYIVLTVGSADVIGVNEKLPVPVQTPIDGITFIPLRFISEWMGVEVIWNQDTQSIILQK